MKEAVAGSAFAERTTRHRPLFSFLPSQTFSEMCNVSTFLMAVVLNHYVEWHLENAEVCVCFGLSLFGNPKQL
jgi:hypothetical protein